MVGSCLCHAHECAPRKSVGLSVNGREHAQNFWHKFNHPDQGTMS